MLVMDTRDIRPDPCDARLINFSNCLQVVHHPAWLSGCLSARGCCRASAAFIPTFWHARVHVCLRMCDTYSHVCTQMLSCLCWILAMFIEELEVSQRPSHPPYAHARCGSLSARCGSLSAYMMRIHTHDVHARART